MIIRPYAGRLRYGAIVALRYWLMPSPCWVKSMPISSSVSLTRRPDGVLQGQQDDAGHYEGPPESGGDANQLVKHLLDARYVGVQGAETDADEEAGGQRAPHSADAVDAEDVQGVVDAELVNQLDGEETDRAGAGADDDGGHHADETGPPG